MQTETDKVVNLLTEVRIYLNKGLLAIPTHFMRCVEARHDIFDTLFNT